MSEHTPGPWEIQEQGEASVYVIMANGNWLLSFRHNGEQLDEKQKANIKLMAAAPELLEACKAIVNNWESGDLAHAANKCANAIAKATGE